jgi:hypothetical protein
MAALTTIEGIGPAIEAKLMGEVNEAKKLVRSLPSADTVSGWVGQAKDLPRVVTH